MPNSMPTFEARKNNVHLGYVNAVSYEQAIGRAHGKFGRCEVLACGNVAINRSAKENGWSDMSYTHGRSPYATPGFEARREALIAAHKANA